MSKPSDPVTIHEAHERMVSIRRRLERVLRVRTPASHASEVANEARRLILAKYMAGQQ